MIVNSLQKLVHDLDALADTLTMLLPQSMSGE